MKKLAITCALLSGMVVLHGVAAAVGDFLREAGMEAAHFIKTAF
jgi:hypothetical protein